MKRWRGWREAPLILKHEKEKHQLQQAK